MDGSEPHSDTMENDSDSHGACLLCAHPMSEHRIDHSGRDGILRCPVDHLPAPQDGRFFNELGMPRGD